MKRSFKFLSIALVAFVVLTAEDCVDVSAASGTAADVKKTQTVGNTLANKQPTPTDIDYSLERWNLIRRAYWVNGQREKARMLPCPIADVPLGYIVLFADNGSVLGRFIVEGKVSSLNSFLSPYSEYFEVATGNTTTIYNKWLPDTDGSFGVNSENGIFFFTPDGKYLEYVGKYLYSDIPFEVKDPVLKIESK